MPLWSQSKKRNTSLPRTENIQEKQILTTSFGHVRKLNREVSAQPPGFDRLTLENTSLLPVRCSYHWTTASPFVPLSLTQSSIHSLSPFVFGCSVCCYYAGPHRQTKCSPGGKHACNPFQILKNSKAPLSSLPRSSWKTPFWALQNERLTGLLTFLSITPGLMHC